MLQTLETLQPCKNTRRNGGVSTNWNSGEWVISNDDASTAAWNDSRRVLARASGFVTSVSPLDRSDKHNFTSPFFLVPQMATASLLSVREYLLLSIFQLRFLWYLGAGRRCCLVFTAVAC